MRKIGVCLVLLVLLCGVQASAENFTGITMGMLHDADSVFFVSYHAWDDRYWVMVRKRPEIFGVEIPVGFRYQVYSVNGSLSEAKRIFSTGRRIYRIIAGEDCLFYEREVLFDPLSQDIFCYNASTNENRKCMPGLSNRLLAASPKMLLFTDCGELCLYDFSRHEERLLSSIANVVSSDRQGIYYLNDEHEMKLFQFEDCAVHDVNIPENIDYIVDGCGISQTEGLLYMPSSEMQDVSYLKNANDFAVTNGILYAYFADTNRYIYMFLQDATNVHQVKIKLNPAWDLQSNIDGNILLLSTGKLMAENGKLFWLIKDQSAILIFDAQTATTTMLPLP